MPHKMTTIPYRISGIKTTQFALFPEKFINGKEITIQTSFSFGYNERLDSIRCISNFEYLQDEIILMISEIQCTFDISPEGTSKLKQLKKVPVDFLRYMATIVTGTARGIIHAKSEGTLLAGIILPPINLMEVIKNDLPINE